MKTGIQNITKRRGMRGDTIVEVLISITIISFVLGAAYMLTSHSLQAAIAARERTEALNYMQGQIERLKSVKENISKTDFDTTYRDTNAYCLVADPTTNVVSKKQSADPACRVDSANLSNGRYRLSTTYINGGANDKTFRFLATWERVGKGTTESADIYYRAAP